MTCFVGVEGKERDGRQRARLGDSIAASNRKKLGEKGVPGKRRSCRRSKGGRGQRKSVKVDLGSSAGRRNCASK